MRVEFIIAHIRIVVEAPYELNVTEGYSFYQVPSQDESVPEMQESHIADFYDTRDRICGQSEQSGYYEIHMMEDSAFPKIEGRILFRNEMNLYLNTKEGEVLHFFRIPLTRQVAAWCETMGKQALTIHYQQVARNYFESVAGCFNAAAFENILFIYRKFLFHCSYVDIGGEAVLFSAHSGGGKTTHALLWEQCGLGEMINGDRAAIEKVGDSQYDEENRNPERSYRQKYMVHGLPIAGSSNVFKNRSLPLCAIFMLEKAPVNEVVELLPTERFLKVLEQVTIHTWDREFVNTASDFVAELVQNVPVKILRCRPDKGAVDVVRKALNILQ